jgi:hypothetical protein
MSPSESIATSAVTSGIRNRWLQLFIGIADMVAIANLQYGWTLFVNPIGIGWARSWRFWSSSRFASVGY